MKTISKKKLPIGIDIFEKVRLEDFYYIDKTGFIVELLQNWGEVNLFTRPRRFGKSLNMSMLESFFSIEGDKQIFDGLAISKEKALCAEYMGKYPVIFISLKGVNAPSYETACRLMIQIINEAAAKAQYLLESGKLTEYDKAEYRMILDKKMEEADIFGSLKKLSRLLEKHHDSKVILLIDEYDVPLAKAFDNGYYDQMVFLIRNLFEQALKTNSSLKFAVLTGCMRISKESIFTGLNNLKVLSVSDERFDEYYGFTDCEVRELLNYYGVADHYNTVKEWYDGYQFGSENIYCPWDVLNYCDKIRSNSFAEPENYWINTSSNDAVKRFIRESANLTTKNEIERLIAGETVTKEMHQELTYQDMYDSVENIWSVLFTTGYLTQRGKPNGRFFKLAIPNREIRDIFVTQIMEYFKETVQKDGYTLELFCEALKNGDAKTVEQCFESYLRKTISIRDTFVKKESTENFYHGILLGILGFKEGWGVFSNREAGDGYSDILVETENSEVGILIEVKYARDGNLDAACKKAFQQVWDKKYEEELLDEGVEKILKYAIACYKKRCKVMLL